ncbi:MAG: TIGR03960 family B12-binding radical SAM protein [Bacteroides sp.]|nr:TIGR03960 family B12-binding radical SAM protein [Bacteroides sp.]
MMKVIPVLKSTWRFDSWLESNRTKEVLMEHLALSDEILMRVEKPARYIGNEVNSVVKERSRIAIRFAMCFPDVYEIGMSYLGIQILYDMFNRMEDVWCERVYSPWPDLDAIMREQQIPLFALESQEPIRDFDFLGITLQYEMCYTNVLQVIDLSQIPLRAEERGEEDPIVIGGGPCSYNPEPMADFFDLFYIGDGETVYRELFDAYKENKARGGSRQEFLELAAEIEGIYVPQFYAVTYDGDGRIASFTPKNPHAKPRIKKQVVLDFEHTPFPMKPVVPFIKATQDRVTLEIQRGCIRGCRFCQAGAIYRPTREKDVALMKRYALEMIRNTGYDEITLSSLSSSDYKALPELTEFLIDEMGKQKVNIALPSLRIDSFSLDVMKRVQDIKKSSLTFAAEAGTQRLRNVINKGLTEEMIREGAMKAFQGGWTKVKFYFMVGLPTETEEDLMGIPQLCEQLAEDYYTIPKEERIGKVSITASSSFFVPKPFTPFQWASMNREEEFLRKARYVKDGFLQQKNRKSMTYRYHDADLTIMEGIFARGDRRLAPAILQAYQNGCIYDAWHEQFQQEIWDKAFEEHQIDIDFYTTRERSVEEILPWDFIDIGVSKQFLIREWERAKKGEVTPNCKQNCSGCGAAVFGGGVCFEDKN